MTSRLLASAFTLVSIGLTSMAAAADAGRATSTLAEAYDAAPVKWQTWGEEAFRRAREEGKPIFLHVGVFTSELGRAMVRQTFSHPDTAAFIDENFVPVLVDREQEPALAALYRSYLRNVKQLEGWPLNLWLTPELKPIDGATYLPPTEEWGKPGFMVVAKQVASAWQSDPEAQRQKAGEAVGLTEASEYFPEPTKVDAAELNTLLTGAAEAWQARHDAAHGGFGDPPKFLEPELLRFLLRQPAQRDLALQTLGAMVDGGIRDPLDGGFFKQTSDAAWRQPYLQKHLTDQARVALALLDAAKLSDDPRFAEGARGALTYMLDQLGTPEGAFAAAQDGTGEVHTATYLWTLAEIRDVLGDRDAREFARAFGVTADGNIPADAYAGIAEGRKNVLHRAAPRGDAAAEAALAKSAAKLLAARRERPAPRIDRTATSGAHGLALAALVRGGAELDEPRFRDAAQRTFDHLRTRLYSEKSGLKRTAGNDEPASPDDHAFAIDGLLAFHAATGDTPALALAEKLRAAADQKYFDPALGRYFSSPGTDAPGIWARLHVPTPAAGELPSPEAAMLIALNTHRGSAGDATTMAQLTAALAAEIRDAFDAPRGDVLLALQAWRDRQK